MYQPQLSPTWVARLTASGRTLIALALIAILASAVSVHWSSQVSATGSTSLTGDFVAPLDAVPVAIDGTLVGVGADTVAVVERGSDSPVAFLLSADTRVLREGAIVSATTLATGDTLRMTVDGRTGAVLRVHATPAAPRFQVPAAAALLATLGLIAGGTALVLLNRDRLPALPTRRLLPRLAPAAATR
jgi:hypothetical protein